MDYLEFEAQKLLDSRWSTRRTKRIIRMLLGALLVAEEERDAATQSAESFSTMFDQLAPTVGDAVERAHDVGRQKVLEELGGMDPIATLQAIHRPELASPKDDDE